MEKGQFTLGSYGDYEDAQRAVDALADRGFPVDELAIVARDLRLVEQVTGRETWVSAALTGVLNGALTGAFLGFLFGLFSIVAPLVSGLALAFYGLLLGAVVGVVVGIIAHAASSSRGNFRSTRTLDAARYEVMCGTDISADARATLEAQRVPAGR